MSSPNSVPNFLNAQQRFEKILHHSKHTKCLASLTRNCSKQIQDYAEHFTFLLVIFWEIFKICVVNLVSCIFLTRASEFILSSRLTIKTLTSLRNLYRRSQNEVVLSPNVLFSLLRCSFRYQRATEGSYENVRTWWVLGFFAAYSFIVRNQVVPMWFFNW